MIKGIVKRPAYGNGDGVLTLTASVTKGSVTKTKVFEASVKEAGMTDTQIVMSDKALIDIQGKDSIKNNISLIYVGKNGSTITWVSDNSDCITNEGIVTRPQNGEENATVKMTATITKGSITETKEIACTVLPWTDEEEVDLAMANITLSSILGANTDKSAILNNLNLPSTGLHDTQVTWISSVPGVIDNTGIVTRPSYTDGDRTVSLTCYIKKNAVTKTMYFMALKVQKLPITNLESVSTSINYIDASVFKGSNDGLDSIISDMQLPKTIPSKPECSTVTLSWKVVKDDGSDDSTNPNIKITDAGDHFNAIITRPEEGTANVTAKIQVISNSRAAAGSEYSQNKSFSITILQQS